MWVTDQDNKNGVKYWRQTALATLLDAHPYPDGRARLLPVLTGISEKEFREANPEFMTFVRI